MVLSVPIVYCLQGFFQLFASLSRSNPLVPKRIRSLWWNYGGPFSS